MDMCITGMYREVVYHPPTYLFVRGNDLTMNQAKTDTVSETETEQQQRHRERERET